MEENKYKKTKKIKGMFFNYNKDEELVNSTIKTFRKLNYVGLGKINQSIHHINFIDSKYGLLDKIIISYRPSGIKPEDIDGFLLENKKEKEKLSDYENGLYIIWKNHYDKGITQENKITNKILIKLHELKSKWTNQSIIPIYTMSNEYQEELKEEAEEIAKSLYKYEL